MLLAPIAAAPLTTTISSALPCLLTATTTTTSYLAISGIRARKLAYISSRNASTLRYRHIRLANQHTILSLNVKTAQPHRAVSLPVLGQADFWRMCRPGGGASRRNDDRRDAEELRGMSWEARRERMVEARRRGMDDLTRRGEGERAWYMQEEQMRKQWIARMAKGEEEARQRKEGEQAEQAEKQWIADKVKAQSELLKEQTDRMSKRMEHFADRADRMHAMMRRRLERDPYEAIFGWSNRLRAGLPPQNWVWGDMLRSKQEAKEPVKEDVQKVSEEEDAAKRARAEAAKRYDETSLGMEPTGSTAYKDWCAANNTEHGADADLEYDPISNRMVRRNAAESDSFGQSLNNATSLHESSARDNMPRATENDMPQQASPEGIQAELMAYKARRFPKDMDEATSSYVYSDAVEKEGTYSDKRVRSSEETQSVSSTGIEANKSAAPDTEVAQRQEQLRELSDQLSMLGKRLSKLPTMLGDVKASTTTVEQPKPQGSVQFQSTTQTNASEVPSFVQKDTPASRFRNLLEAEKDAEKVAETSDAQYVSRIRADNYRRLLEIERLKEEEVRLSLEQRKLSNDLTELQWNRSPKPADKAKQHAYNEQRRLALEEESSRIQSKIARLEQEKEKVYPFRLWDQGREEQPLKQQHDNVARPGQLSIIPPSPDLLNNNGRFDYVVVAYHPATSVISSSITNGTITTDPLLAAHLEVLKKDGMEFVAISSKIAPFVFGGSARGTSRMSSSEQAAETNMRKPAAGDYQWTQPADLLEVIHPSRPSPKRMEEIYTGPRYEQPRRPRRRWFRRILFWTATGGVILYVCGLNSGFKPVRVRVYVHDKDPKGIKPEGED
ncbi:hypothetical protein BT63DRAFT_117265 [Microthyrium microscopicum]|uniref:Uncharacterized protein n=1 Tax=Microthyrium microscopicum TaxID=703497 RepID=A0A6A6TXX0_9PEZI|nr:hypothetical protein BT63DRAFT_117265 [Microthyrium microscopicum]